MPLMATINTPLSWTWTVLLQAARQGLTVLMASAMNTVVGLVLKHETSTPPQSYNCISIDFKFGVGNYVREITSTVKFSSDPMATPTDSRWRQHIRVLWLFGFKILRQVYSTYTWTDISTKQPKRRGLV